MAKYGWFAYFSIGTGLSVLALIVNSKELLAVGKEIVKSI